jgi:hypothetical protein
MPNGSFFLLFRAKKSPQIGGFQEVLKLLTAEGQAPTAAADWPAQALQLLPAE